MTHRSFARGATLAAWIAASAALLAQSGSGIYNPTEEITITGTILHVVSLQAPDGFGVHFDFKTAAGLVNVHVAPAIYIGASNFWFFADDQVEITGVKMFVDGNKSFVARAIKKADGKVLKLRGADGFPLWAPPIDGTDGCGVSHPVLPRGTEM
jgi:hypothetical protein